MPESRDITGLLKAISHGESPADALFPLVYDELRRLASVHLSSEAPNHTLQPTALVHEAYLRLVDTTRMEWRDRAHFMAVASQAIRRILVDYARRRSAKKRGGRLAALELDQALEVPSEVSIGGASGDILHLDEALRILATEHPEKARVVELRFFGGLTIEETAEVMQIGERTANRYWFYARSWLFRQITAQNQAAEDVES